MRLSSIQSCDRASRTGLYAVAGVTVLSMAVMRVTVMRVTVTRIAMIGTAVGGTIAVGRSVWVRWRD